MKLKPILLGAPMARAALEGEKTTMRQLVRDPYYIDDEEACRAMGFAIHGGTEVTHGMPYPDAPYSSGDILYVREAWKVQSARRFDAGAKIMFKAGGPMSTIHFTGEESQDTGREEYDAFVERWMKGDGWHPSIMMPKKAARTFLRVTTVLVERLQEITVDGILSEGINITPPPICTQGKPTELQKADFAALSKEKQDEYVSALARHTYMGWCQYADDLFKEYAKHWNSTIAAENRDKYGWDANPWVWVVCFERCGKPESF